MSSDPYTHLAWRLEDGVGYLTLRRPPLNILHIPLLTEMENLLADVAPEPGLRLLVLEAEGRLFSAGVDVADHTADRVGTMIPLFNRVCRALAAFPAPTLAVVQGHALGGGCELALCCDLCLAADTARIGQPEIGLATFAPVAALRLPQLVGHALAAEMLFTGRSYPASELAARGLINAAVPSDELRSRRDELVTQLRALSAPVLRLSKRALRLGADGWASLAEIESLYLDELMATEDVHEGLAAFAARRTPEWRHR